LSEKILPGRLVRILTDRTFTSDGLTTAYSHEDGIKLYEKIDLSSYPSCRDFFGEVTNASPDDAATVIRCMGRPRQISASDKWSPYDVYEILIDGKVCQVFRHNITTDVLSDPLV
jgi:hypothetical protein